MDAASRCWIEVVPRRRRERVVLLAAGWRCGGRTALMMMDPYATARSLATPVMVLALGWRARHDGSRSTQRRRFFSSWASASHSPLQCHPLMAAYALGATLMLLAARTPTAPHSALRHCGPWQRRRWFLRPACKRMQSRRARSAAASHGRAPTGSPPVALVASCRDCGPAWQLLSLFAIAN